MKKIISLLLAITLCLSLCACGNTPQQNNQPEGSIEDALEQWPWIADEWHSLYFAEEPVLVMAEDGTFRYRDESGTWTWDGTCGGEDNFARVTVYPDNGDSYWLSFYVENESSARILAENSETGEYLYEDEVRSSESAAPDLAKCDAVIGEWVSLENEFGYSGEVPFMDVREDGTCTILGEDGVWGLPDSQRDTEKVNCLLIKIAGKEYSIEIVYEHYYDNPGYGCVYVVNDEAEPMEFAYAMNLRFPVTSKDDEATETREDDENKTTDNTEAEAPLIFYTSDGSPAINIERLPDILEIVELTTENWREYIKVYSYSIETLETNAFGDVLSTKTTTCYQLGAGNERYHCFEDVAIELKNKTTGELTIYEFGYGGKNDIPEDFDLDNYECTRIIGRLCFADFPEEALYTVTWDNRMHFRLAYEWGMSYELGITNGTNAISALITPYLD